VSNLTLEQIVAELDRRKTYGGWKHRFFTEPNTRDLYPKHWEFFDAGQTYFTRLFTAGNQVGKSVASACELVMHLTGDYHALWQGHRFTHPIDAWIVGRTSELVRQTIQPLLLGQTPNFGTGLIPKDDLDLETLTAAKKSSTSISSFRVKHKSGGFSTVSLKSGEQGREAFQAATLDLIWCDEEIPYDVFNECQVRLMVRNGLMLYSFTPLKGTSDVIKSFSVEGNFVEGDVGSKRYVVRCSMHDVPHQSKENIDQLIASTPPYLRDARIHGYPSLGSGAIWPVPESEFVVEPFAIPDHWKRLYGMDVGAKTGAIWLAQNPDTKQWFAYDEYYKERQEPSIHASSIKLRGAWIPGAIDPASRGRSQIDGQQLMQMYTDLGLNLDKALNAVEAGLYTVWEMLSTDQLKVFRTCTRLLQEMRSYQRNEKGDVVKVADHLCDSFRYSVMTRDIAKQKPVNTISIGLVPTMRRKF
jgi:phage terminase large subunit-like protein